MKGKQYDGNYLRDDTNVRYYEAEDGNKFDAKGVLLQEAPLRSEIQTEKRTKDQTPSSRSNASFPKAPATWPKDSGELTGKFEVRVTNSNDFKVRVGLPSSEKGRDFLVGPD